MSALDIIGSALLLVGAALVLLAGIGVLRMPDVLTRVNAAGKATGLGLAAVLAGAALVAATPRAAVVLGLAVLLQLATSPVSSHVIGRAAYRSGAPLWEGTLGDDLRDHYARHPEPERADGPANDAPGDDARGG